MGIAFAVAVAALIAFAVLLKRRRASKQKITRPQTPLPPHNDNNLEQGREQPPDAPPHPSAVLAVGNAGDVSPSYQRYESPHRHVPAEADGGDGGGIVPSSAPAALAVPVTPRTEHGTDAVGDCGTGLAGEDTADRSASPFYIYREKSIYEEQSLITTSSVATTSVADVSAGERAELAVFHHRESAASTTRGPQPEEVSGGSEASSATDRKKPAGDIGLGHAVLVAAQELAHRCQVPGVSEAAAVVCIMANLVTDSRENDSGSDSRLRQCRSIVMVLKRAAKVVGKVS